MRRIVHRVLGSPADVLEIMDVPAPPSPPAGSVVVKVTFAPVHPGDLLAIEASPAFGSPDVPSLGRTPGFEGAGVIADVGEGEGNWHAGDRVAFFPADGVWSDYAVVPTTSLVRIPHGVSDEIASHALINFVTTKILLQHGHDFLPPDRRTGATVIQTGASSAVGRLLTTMLLRVGVAPVRIVRSRASAAHLAVLHPDVPTVATKDPDWIDQLRNAIGGREIRVALDGVGGALIGELPHFMVVGGLILSYGSMGGSEADIRSIVPRRISIRGVNLSEWSDRSDEERAQDRETAMDLALVAPEVFEVAGAYPPEEVREAVRHAGRRGKTGTVLLSF